MKIRTAMPDTKDEALSCMYMQAMMGDSLSWLNAIKDFTAPGDIILFKGSHACHLDSLISKLLLEGDT